MADNKNQHFVPKAHLKPFSVDGEGKAIHLFNLDAGRAIPNAAVRKQCSHDYLYGRDAQLERAIQTIEGRTGQRSSGWSSRARTRPCAGSTW